MASWDIFCSVVDNYGDIGVTWRLARQLAAEYGQAVRLWVDEPQAFARICPRADPAAHVQCLDGVEVRAWGRPWASVVVAADVVIEAFACELPEAHRQAMRERERPSLWLNLEYLSAEEWIGSCHALPSLQACGLSKYFFFPGFREPSGGLLREAGLLERRRRFQASVSAQDEFLASLGVRRKVGERLISLFAYENPALPGWLEQLRDARQPSLLLVPEGRVLADVADWLRVATLAVGDVHVRDALRVQVLPFMAQDDYDRLLWCCDLNAVRGEDSFVRAQWADGRCSGTSIDRKRRRTWRSSRHSSNSIAPACPPTWRKTCAPSGWRGTPAVDLPGPGRGWRGNCPSGVGKRRAGPTNRACVRILRQGWCNFTQIGYDTRPDFLSFIHRIFV